MPAPMKGPSLLEELTGTEIYGQLSMQVFQSCRELETEQKLTQARLQGMQLLGADELLALEATAQQLNSAQAACTSTATGVAAQIKLVATAGNSL